MTREGKLTTSPSQFGNSWAVAGKEDCPAVGSMENQCTDPQIEGEAKKKCGIVNSSMFKACSKRINTLTWYERCVNDYCGADLKDRHALMCTTLKALASECAENKVVVSWRSASLCRKYTHNNISN